MLKLCKGSIKAETELKKLTVIYAALCICISA